MWDRLPSKFKHRTCIDNKKIVLSKVSQIATAALYLVRPQSGVTLVQKVSKLF